MSSINVSKQSLKKSIKRLILLFIFGLVISGLTAFPVETLLSILTNWVDQSGINNPLTGWVGKVYEGVRLTNANYPFLAYGTDWLAFAHLVIAIAFLGPLKDPVKNIWIIDWQIICCVAVLPLALIAGPIRQIPIFHIVIDCSFGILGIIPLLICKRWIKQLEKQQ